MISSILTGAIAIIGTNGIIQLYKSFQLRYGDTKIHIFAFVLSIGLSLGYSLVMSNPSLLLIAKHIGIILSGSITMYELLWKQLGTIVSTPNVGSSVSPVTASSTNLQ